MASRICVHAEVVDAPWFAELLHFASDLPDAPANLSAQQDNYLDGAPRRPE